MIVGVRTEKGIMMSSPSVYEVEGNKTSDELKNLS